MKPDDVKRLYDDGYAAAYQDRFLTSDQSAADAAHELTVLRGLLAPGSTWLDTACGTGYFLSHFPDIERKGVDLSPGMIRAARARNPGVEILEHDFRVPKPEWADRFDLVSCMWYAYCLVDTVDEVERLVENLSEWTSPAGACFMPLAHPWHIAGVAIPITRDTGYAGVLKITGILWSYSEDDGAKEHKHLVAPQIELMVEMFERRFDDVEIIAYPPVVPGLPGRPALIARNKRASRASGMTTPG